MKVHLPCQHHFPLCLLFNVFSYACIIMIMALPLTTPQIGKAGHEFLNFFTPSILHVLSYGCRLTSRHTLQVLINGP